MRVLLIISGEPKENPQRLSFAEKRFPIGVGYLISVLRKAGHKVDFLDRYLLGDVWPENWNYDLVGIYSSTPTFPDTLHIIEKVPEDIPLTVGGPHTCFNYKSIPDRVDWIIQGEGEEAILDVISGTLPKGVWRYARIENLDELPTPAFDVFEPLPYLKTVEWFPGKVFNFSTGRGCPFSCSFCWVRRIWGHKVTLMSAERIIEDIKKVQKDFKVEGIYFREDNFTVDKRRVERFCKLVRKLKILWCCETRADIDPELIELMYSSGCRALYVGIESGSQKMLEVYNKRLTLSEIELFLKSCKKVGMKVAASFIINHPEEGKEDREATRKLIEKWKPDTIWLNPWREDYVVPKR